MMASLGSPNQPPSPQSPFDMHSFINPTNPNPTTFHHHGLLRLPVPPSPPSLPPLLRPPPPPPVPTPPPTTTAIATAPLPLFPHSSFQAPTHPPPPNAGTGLMALLSAPPPFSFPDFPTVTNLPPMGMMTAANVAVAALNRAQSSKVPKGRHQIGDHVLYDVDARLPGEVQPQLEVMPITKYGSDPNQVLGRQIAVNKSYICYGLKQGNIRVLNIRTAVRSLLRGHTLRVTDLAFFAEDVHLLASVGADGRVYVWKISEGPDVEDKPQITADSVIGIQIVGEEKVENPRICRHCHNQEILIVGMGKHFLRIDTTKVGNGEAFVAEDPPRCPFDKLIDGVQLVGTHDGEVTDLSMCQWMRNRLVCAS